MPKPIKGIYPKPSDEMFSHLNNSCLKYYEDLTKIKVIPPRDREHGYSDNYHYYIINDERIGFNEKQLNFATVLATTDLTSDEAFIKAGYNWVYIFAYNKHLIQKHKLTMSHLRSNLRAEADKARTPKMNALINYLKKYSLEKIVIDAAWLLNEQVNLYMEAKNSKVFSVAAKVLNDISYHIDVDARAANKVEIENTVDYAKVLNEAYNRSNNAKTIKGELNTIVSIEEDKSKTKKAIEAKRKADKKEYFDNLKNSHKDVDLDKLEDILEVASSGD